MRAIKVAAVVFVALLAGGCTSAWEKNFARNPMLDRMPPPTQQVEIRTVEFERLRKYEEAEHARRVESSTAPIDYTNEQRRDAKDRLLEALQLKERGDQVEVLGWSRFIDNDRLDPSDKSLKEFAQKIGADVVVVSSGFAGQASRIVDYPMTSYTNYYTTGVGRGGRTRSFTQTGQSTVWVPTAVAENQFYKQAVFLRRSSSD